jgi:ankyrin repeat protein
MSSEILTRIADGRTDLVFQHLAEGHPAQSTDQSGTPLITWCAYYGDVSAIRFLLREGESLKALGQNLGLDGAAFHGHWQLCQFLIENGADVNHAEPVTGETPLHSALCKANRPAYDLVVTVLLANGANPNCATKKRRCIALPRSGRSGRSNCCWMRGPSSMPGICTETLR